MKGIFIKGLCAVFLMFSLSVHASGPSEGYTLPDDPVFEEPLKSVEKAFSYVERGDRVFRQKPGSAQKYYENAEDYLLKAVFLYKELGTEHGVDVSREVAYCEQQQRKVHTKTADARKKSKNR